MKTPTLLLPSVLLGAVALLTSGCAGTGARRIETGGARAITTVGTINDADFQIVSEKAVASILASGELDKARVKPAIVQVSRIQNRTGLQYDTDLLTQRILVGLSSSGKASVITDPADDPVGAAQSAENAFLADRKVAARPEFTLSGKVIKEEVRVGNLREATFTFQLNLQKPDELNKSVWRFNEPVTKQGTRARVGF